MQEWNPPVEPTETAQTEPAEPRSVQRVVRVRPKRPSWSSAPDLPWQTGRVITERRGQMYVDIGGTGGRDWVCPSTHDIEAL